MTSYTPLLAADMLPDKNWTAGKAAAVYNNPIAIQELDATAPKPRVSVDTGVLSSSGPYTVSGFDNFDGVELIGSVENISSGSDNIDVSLSSDGVTFYGAATIASVVTGSLEGNFHLLINFSDGVFQGWYRGAGGSGAITGTAGLPPDTVTHVRMTASAGSNTSYVTMKRIGSII